MAHNIAFNTVTNKHSFFSARQAAWHKLGQVVASAQSWQEAMQLAGLNWSVSKQQLQSPNGMPIEVWGIFRDDNNDFLGSVGRQYTPIQNQYQFDFVNAILESENEAHYETAGALGKGERVFCLASVGDGFTIAGTDDKHQTYLLFMNAHDGTSTAKCLLTSVRVVCQNTLNQALAQGCKNALSIRHTQGANDKLAQAKSLIEGSHITTAKLRDKLNALAERKVSKDSFLNVLNKLFGSKEKDEQSSRSQNIMLAVANLFEKNDGNAIPEIRGTAYNLLNAVTEYTDHFRSVRQTEGRIGNASTLRAETALFGTGAQLKEQALEVILESTQFDPRRSLQTLYSLPTPKRDMLDELLENPIIAAA